jgi:hypothetical protein
MKRDWVKGWNGGLTGPNTPWHPTVHYSIVYNEWENDKTHTKRYPEAYDYFIPIACGSDTVAIAVGPDREEIATLIAKAPRMEETITQLSEELNKAIRERNSLYAECNSLRSALNTIRGIATDPLLKEIK